MVIHRRIMHINFLDNIWNITLFGTDFMPLIPGPWERSSEPSDTGSSKEMEPEHYVCCSTNQPHLSRNICAQSRLWTKNIRDGS